jgi:hypothetical protein
MANTTNYNWETPDDTDLVKDGAAAIRTLGNSIDTTTKNLNPETTTGDIAYRSATANTNTRLAIGSTGQVLTVAAGVPSWATPTDQTPLTTKGDVFTFSTVDARLGVGANGTVLTADSAETTGLKWAAPAASTPSFVGCRLTKTAAQTIANNTSTALTWDSEVFDVGGFHDNVTNNTRITIPTGKTGYYLVVIHHRWDTNATGIREHMIYVNGSTEYQVMQISAASAGRTKFTASQILLLSAGDYVESFALQTSGGNLATDYTTTTMSFSVSLLGA